jgi:hypothetical protein
MNSSADFARSRRFLKKTWKRLRFTPMTLIFIIS